MALVWPVAGEHWLTSLPEPGHTGLDLAAPLGTPVLCVAAGEVAWVDTDIVTPTNNGGYGRYVRVYHPDLRVHSFYAHLETQEVRRGDRVVAGQRLGALGSTGNSTGPHLHFEVRTGDNFRLRIDPLEWWLRTAYGVRLANTAVNWRKR